MEKDRESNPQDTVDATTGDTARRESLSSPQGEEAKGRYGRAASCGDEDEYDELEERVRRDCRRTCRRRLFVELLKTLAKIAGVILAAMGLSSFGEED